VPHGREQAGPFRAGVLAVADVADWDIGPTKESSCALTVKLTVNNYEDVAAMRALAQRKQVVLRLLPLQPSLPVGAMDECAHDMMIDFSRAERVCLSCGRIIAIPVDDQVTEAEGDQMSLDDAQGGDGDQTPPDDLNFDDDPHE